MLATVSCNLISRLPGVLRPYKRAYRKSWALVWIPVTLGTESTFPIAVQGRQGAAMKITKSFLAASVLLLSVVIAREPNSQDELASQKQVSDTLRQMYEAEKRKDLHFVLDHLSDDFAEVAGDGNVYHRSDIEAGWSDVTLKDYKLSDCIFKLLTRDAAYLTCRMELNASYKGQPLPQRFRVTWVWTRQNSSWLVRFEQGTVIAVQKQDIPAKRN